MKKVALSLLAFALVGAVAFAQDAAPVVKLSGYVDTGIKAVKVDTADYTFQEYANDYDAAGTWGKVTAAVTGANYGASVTLKGSDQTLNSSATLANGTDKTAAFVLLDTAKAWFTFTEGLTGFIGTGYNDAFDGVDDKSNDNFWNSNGYGLSFATSGFAAGAHVGAPAVAGAYAPLGFGAAYALDKVVTLRASFKTNANALSDLAVSGSISAVENLSLSAGYFSSAMDSTAVNAADVAASYAITPAFSAGVVAYDYLTAEYYTVKPNASFKVTDALTVSGYYKLFTEGKAKVTNPSDNEINGKVAYVVGTGTLSAWVTYNTAAKQTVLATDYVISF